ncbi:MAG: hypothetical protein COU63_04690 [Candidatus Pacebacteria bacterium CG10_big_fil_rev_8_21_14_0_10_36_11]|nr:HAD family hydrolase [Candidatus Pacearchaeota archaeon]OIP73994.1 MAG: hypothetical protein AUK08_01925 [Candidatus Pacebacteria bacterium CG2_30_36_39]PIR64367.1 MAG: hypothetical protein COU63_04690 [Candidatus Pacebacteria bacterium CG10_big_fil_rev_8_21_14_0_10_36_11]
MTIELANKKIEAIVLDFDGTFYSANKELEAKIWGEARKKLITKILEFEGITSFTPEYFNQRLEEFIQEAQLNGWRVSFKKFGGTDEGFDEVISSVSVAEFLDFDQQLVDLLTELMSHVPVYIFTGSHRKRCWDALDVLVGDLINRFENSILAADDMEFGRKPVLAAYQEMVDRFALNPETTIFVDDQLVEVNSAAELGIMTFLIHETTNGEEAIGSHILINSLKKLLDHLVIKE